MRSLLFRIHFLMIATLLVVSCAPAGKASSEVQMPVLFNVSTAIPPGFRSADGSHQLVFPEDFGAHPSYMTEWWYYTGNLETREGRHFGFELTVFRVGLLPPTTDLPEGSAWSNRDVYFAHFAVSDIADQKFHAFERYSRPGPGLAGAQSEPYRVWLEDWTISEQSAGVYRLQAAQAQVAVDLMLTDEMGVVLHGDNGYSRQGQSATNASYYFSQPRLHADGRVELNGDVYEVTGLAWMDHEFSTGVLDENQVGWDWFSLQFGDGRALMLFQLRERDGQISDSSSGTFIAADGTTRPLFKQDFAITVKDKWQSPHTGGVYPSSWRVTLNQQNCVLEVEPWMPDQEIHFPVVTYWEGAVHVTGTCDQVPVQGNGYIELTGYAGNLPLP